MTTPLLLSLFSLIFLLCLFSLISLIFLISLRKEVKNLAITKEQILALCDTVKKLRDTDAGNLHRVQELQAESMQHAWVDDADLESQVDAALATDSGTVVPPVDSPTDATSTQGATSTTTPAAPASPPAEDIS